MEVGDGFLPALCIHSLREAPTTAVFGILAESQKYIGYGLNERELTEGFWKLDPDFHRDGIFNIDLFGFVSNFDTFGSLVFS